MKMQQLTEFIDNDMVVSILRIRRGSVGLAWDVERIDNEN